MSGSCPRQKVDSSSAILEQSRVILTFVFAGQAGRVRCIVICINSSPTQMIDGTEKPIRSFENAQRDTTKFGYNSANFPSRFLRGQ